MLQSTVLLLGLCSQSRCCQPLASPLLYDLIYHLLSVPPGTSSFSESVIKTLQNSSTISKEVQLSSEPDTLFIIIVLFCEWGNINFLLLIHSFSVMKWGQTGNTCLIACNPKLLFCVYLFFICFFFFLLLLDTEWPNKNSATGLSENKSITCKMSSTICPCLTTTLFGSI